MLAHTICCCMFDCKVLVVPWPWLRSPSPSPDAEDAVHSADLEVESPVPPPEEASASGIERPPEGGCDDAGPVPCPKYTIETDAVMRRAYDAFRHAGSSKRGCVAQVPGCAQAALW